jgi:hypothetical protein
MDSTQRALAVSKALEYVAKNPGKGYPTDEQTHAGQFKGKPGEPTDCAGMVNGCVVAGGEKSIYDQGKDGGVKNVIAASEKKGEKAEDLSNAQVGNALTLNNTKRGPLDPGKNDKHTGVLIKLELDSDGRVLNASMAHSSGSAGSEKSGPRIDVLVKDGKLTYWGQRITGIWKWDKKPD